MDGLEGIQHSVAFKSGLNIRHIVEISPEAVNIAREVRYCVITIAVCLTTVALIRVWGARDRSVR